jgi:GAF domain-containing protein
MEPVDSIVARSVVEKKPFVIPDASKDPRVNPVLKEKFSLHSLVVIPLLAKEKALGAIAADYVEPGKNITPDVLESVITFAQQAGLAIHHAFMYQNSGRSASRWKRRFKTTAALRKIEAQLILSENCGLGQLAAGTPTRFEILDQHQHPDPFFERSLSSKNSHREDLKVIEEEIDRINEIVDQFLRFARPSSPFREGRSSHYF